VKKINYNFVFFLLQKLKIKQFKNIKVGATSALTESKLG